MKAHRRSYWKTILAASGGAAVAAAMAIRMAWSGRGPILAALAAGAAVLGLAVAIGGVVVLYLDDAEDRVARTSHPGTRRHRLEPHPAGTHPRRLPMFGIGALRVGDLVQVRSREEILQTLDDRGTLDGLPFMPEMLTWCGRRFRVFRRVDKIHDWVHQGGLRRMRDAVTLEGVRCDGGAHGGCQAGCQVIWKGAWLKRVRTATAAELDSSAGGGGESIPSVLLASRTRVRASVGEQDRQEPYACQVTELPRATAKLSPWDVRQDLRPLLAGNVGAVDWAVVMLHRLFTAVQRARGGSGFPAMEPSEAPHAPETVLGLQPGEWVRVKRWRDIAPTLVRNRNRGLWFDRDMLRFCGRTFRVLYRVNRIIDEGTGRMLTLRHPCLVLDGVTATGEFLRFCPQNEYIFWREVWLERLPEPRPS